MYQYIKNLLSILSISLLFVACSQKEIQKSIFENSKDEDLILLSQEANDNAFNKEKNLEEYLKKFFSPWKQNKLSYSKEDAMWGLSYKNRKVYLENHRLATKEWFNKIIENTNFDKYNLEVKKAITLKNTNLRVLPTNSPLFYNPKLPGEGFPFDYNQNSLLKINTPLIVSHLSKDKAWAYVESFLAGGWVNIDNIAFVDENFIKEFSNSNYYISVKEKFPFYTQSFRDYAKLGTIFPKKYDKFIIASKNDNLEAFITYIDLKKEEVEALPLQYNYINRVRILKEFLNEAYGWGGLLNNRDCSSFTQDYFSVFGKHLNRNSKAQTTNGKYIDISNLSLKEKKEFIKNNAIAFSTLIYLKGHIMLYIGNKDDEPLVAHNIWSIKLKDKEEKEFRHIIIGKMLITTLEPAKEEEGFTEDSNILKRVLGIVIL